MMNNSINGGLVVGINNNLTLNQSPNINTSSNALVVSNNNNGGTPNQNSNNNQNPSVMTYNPTYNKCLPKILSDLDCEMRVKQVLKCVESMLAEGADEASLNAHAVPHSNSPNAPGFSSFKLSSNSLNNGNINSNGNNIISDRQVPGTSTPQKKLKRSDYSETTPKLLESSPLIPNQSTQSTPNISSLSNQTHSSSPRKSATNGSSSPKNKIKINIAGRIDEQRNSNNNSPIQGQPSNGSPIIKQNNLEILDSSSKKSISSANSSVQQSPIIQQQMDDQRRPYFYSPQLGMVNQQGQMVNQQGQVIAIQGTPVMNPQGQQNGIQSPQMIPFSIEDPRRMMYQQQYDQNQQMLAGHLQDPSRRHSFAPYGVSQSMQDPNSIIDQQRRMSYSTFESQQQQQNMMQQIQMAQYYQHQIQQQQHIQHQQQHIQQQVKKSPTIGVQNNTKLNEQSPQYIDQQQNLTECKKEEKLEIQQQPQQNQPPPPQENRNQQFCLSTPTLSAYPGVNPTGVAEEDSWILSFFSEEAQDNPDQLKSNQG